jgi:hypothetical protein
VGSEEGGGESDVGGADVGGGADVTGGGTDRRDDPRRITVASDGAKLTCAVHAPRGAAWCSTEIVTVAVCPSRSTPDVADNRSHRADVLAAQRTSPPLAVSVTTVRPAEGAAVTVR